MCDSEKFNGKMKVKIAFTTSSDDDASSMMVHFFSIVFLGRNKKDGVNTSSTRS